MPNVIVVPETEEFTNHVSHENVIWITSKLGTPKLKENNATYIAPYWLHGTKGVNRIYHIAEFKPGKEAATFVLGNSFVVPEHWAGMGQHRRFEYHALSTFGYVEICPGLLTPEN